MSPKNDFGQAIDFGKLALDFVGALDSLKTKKEVLVAVQAALEGFGFEHFAVSELPYPFQTHVPHVLLMKAPTGWTQLYTAKRFYLTDPVVRACRESTQPFEWREMQVDPRRDAQGVEVMCRAMDFGLNHGLTLPIRNLNGLTSCFSMSAGAQPYLNRFTKPAIHLMALYAHERARELDTAAPVRKPVLTPREREVLTWAAAGKSASDIADILGISERTAIAHTINATHKLGASNKTQAVVIALHCKLIAV